MWPFKKKPNPELMEAQKRIEHLLRAVATLTKQRDDLQDTVDKLRSQIDDLEAEGGECDFCGEIGQLEEARFAMDQLLVDLLVAKSAMRKGDNAVLAERIEHVVDRMRELAA